MECQQGFNVAQFIPESRILGSTRRMLYGGELGGPQVPKILTAGADGPWGFFLMAIFLVNKKRFP